MAEDIGKFPDPNVAASLQRLPGVSVQVSGNRGEATGVTVRGFSGDFNETLYDGRHISTATGGRAWRMQKKRTTARPTTSAKILATKYN